MVSQLAMMLRTVRWSWLDVDCVLDTSAANLEKIEAGEVPLATRWTRRLG